MLRPRRRPGQRRFQSCHRQCRTGSRAGAAAGRRTGPAGRRLAPGVDRVVLADERLADHPRPERSASARAGSGGAAPDDRQPGERVLRHRRRAPPGCDRRGAPVPTPLPAKPWAKWTRPPCVRADLGNRSGGDVDRAAPRLVETDVGERREAGAASCATTRATARAIVGECPADRGRQSPPRPRPRRRRCARRAWCGSS